MSFDLHPDNLVAGAKVSLINSIEDREEILNRCFGISDVILAHFDESMMHMPWDVFIEEYLYRQLKARHLEQGEMQEAMRFLGHPHCLSGEVVHGRQLGRTIGVPTANLLIPEGVLTPAFGVYATKVILPDGSEKLAVTNVGVRPTVGESNLVTVEPWILGFEGDLYGQHIRVDFYQRLRGEKRFDGLTALQQEIFANAQETRELLG